MSHHEHAHGEPHVLPLSVYFTVFGALLCLTVLTYLVSFAGLPGGLSIGVAMLVAIAKATLVCMFFMHLKYDDRLNSVVLISSILMMGLFFVFTLADELSRGFTSPEEGTLAKVQEDAALKAEKDAANPPPAEAPAHGEHGAEAPAHH